MVKVPKIAFLVVPDFQKSGRTVNESFDGVGNVGAYVCIDQLRRRGVDVGFCSFDTASEYDVVCISLTSSYDVLSLWKNLRFRSDWERGRRRFRVICGGAGLKNPFPLLEWVDAFWFGRCDTEFYNFATNPDFEHPSLMRWNEPRKCVVNQAACLYPHSVILGDGTEWSEKFIGCPNKCYFCFYSYTRRHSAPGQRYFLETEHNKQSMEIDLLNWGLLTRETIRPHVTVGVDGVSGRIRCAINKPITDEKLLELVVRHNRAIPKENYKLKLYMITGYETETMADVSKLHEVMREADKEARTRTVVEVHSTPLSPEPGTPLAWSAAPYRTPFDSLRGQMIMQGRFLQVFHCKFNASDFQQFQQLVVTRYTEKQRKLLDNLLFNAKFSGLKNRDKMTWIEDHFDLHDLLREYDINEELPAWPLVSYMGEEKVKKLRTIAKKRLCGISQRKMQE